MSYEFYKVLHLVCILLLACSLAGSAVLRMVGDPEGEHASVRKRLAIAQGVALVLIFVAGFGLMARKGIGIGAANSGWPGWIFGKIGVWLAFGAVPAFIKRKTLGWHALWLIPALVGVGAYLAVVHPGSPT